MLKFRVAFLVLLTLVNNYFKPVKTQGCTTSFTAQPDTHSLQGTALPNATSISQCQQYCISAGWCGAVDWDPQNPQGNKCWLSNPTATTQSSPGVTHFVLVCPPSVTGTTAAPAPCTFTISQNNHTLGGVLQPSATNIQICQNLCISNGSCNGIDWNSGSPQGQQCWFSFPSNTFQGLQGIDHYTITCVSPPPTSAPTPLCWSSVKNTVQSTNRILQPYTDLTSCLNGCLQTSSCKNSVDWYPYYTSQQQCYFALNSSIANYSGDPLQHFTYSPNCNNTGNALSSAGYSLMLVLILNVL